MMLCCKEIVPERKGKTGKSSSMLRKDKSWSKTVIEKRKLALKGRIFVSNIAKSEVLPPDPSGESRLPAMQAIAIPLILAQTHMRPAWCGMDGAIAAP